MVAGILGAAVSIVAAAILAVVIQHYLESLKHEKSRKILGERLSHPVYFGLLKGRLDWLEKVFGPTMGVRPFRLGGKGFGICLFLALCYAVASFTIGWMLGAPGTLGDIPMFVDDGSLAGSWPRPVRAIVVLLLPFVGFLFFRWTAKKVAAWPPRRGATGHGALHVLYWTINLSVAGTVGYAGVNAVAGTVATLAVSIVFIAGAANIGVGFIVTGVATIVTGSAVAFAVAVGVGVDFAAVGVVVDFDAIVGSCMFFVILPLLNAFWDWGSLSLSRRLGREILQKNSAASALWLAVVDIVAAAGFLVSLVVFLPFFAGVLERLTTVSLDLGGYLEGAAANPWTLGFWATFMLLSTLLPTAAHAAVALFSVLPCAGRESWRETLKKKIDSGIEANYLLPALYFSFWWIVSVGLVGLAGWGISWLLVTGDVPVAETLLRLARWSLELSGAPVS